ncbi:MAG TPA: hypothetical protein VF478_08165, partial [Anaerolineae bacterium]
MTILVVVKVRVGEASVATGVRAGAIIPPAGSAAAGVDDGDAGIFGVLPSHAVTARATQQSA